MAPTLCQKWFQKPAVFLFCFVLFCVCFLFVCLFVCFFVCFFIFYFIFFFFGCCIFFFSKSSKFRVVCTIRFCSNFTSMWYKHSLHALRNVCRDFMAKLCQGGCYCWRFSTSAYPGWAIWHLSVMQFLSSGSFPCSSLSSV